MNRKSFIGLCIGTIFSAIGIYLAFRNVPLSALIEYALKLDYKWLLPAAAAFVTAYIVRTIRWRWLLLISKKVRFTSAYHSIVISMMINCLLPGRFGELARPLVLKRVERVLIPASLASLGVERLLDLWALLILFMPAFLALSRTDGSIVHFGSHTLSRDLLIHLSYMSLATAIVLLTILFAIGSDRIRIPLIVWMHRWPVFLQLLGLDRMSRYMGQILPRLTAFFEAAATGLKSISHVNGFLRASGYSLVTWGFNALCFYFLSIASPGVDLSFGAICGVMVMICLFIALPSVPGFWGLWEAAGVFALSFYGIPKDIAAGYALFSHGFTFIPVILAGWLSCMMLGFNWRIDEQRATTDAVEAKSGQLAGSE